MIEIVKELLVEENFELELTLADASLPNGLEIFKEAEKEAAISLLVVS
jgi:hypothetical protein